MARGRKIVFSCKEGPIFHRFCHKSYFKRPFAATKEMPKDSPEYWKEAYEWAKSPKMSY